jgi:protoporphyrinogen oxidase
VRERAGAPGEPPPADFGSWVERTFGRGIAERFMRPYNRKIWCRELREMSADWVADRISQPDPDRSAAGTGAGRDRREFGANRTFSFPRTGGTGELWRRAAAALPAGRLRYSAAVTELDPAARSCRLDSGEEIGFGSAIWTGPLDLLAARCGRPGLAAAAAGLEHTSVEVLGMGLAGSPPEAVRDMCWMYFPEPGPPFYRATVLSNYSPGNVPRPGETWSLLLEVARRPGWKCRPEELWPRLARSALAEGLLPGEAGVISRWHRTLERAYPVPGLKRESALAGLLPELESRGVYPRGRFGAWRYEVGNMDHCWMQGVQVVDRILDGRPETVLRPLEEG